PIPADRLLVASHRLTQEALLRCKLDLVDRVLRKQLARGRKGARGGLELAGKLVTGAERSPNARDLARLEPRDGARARQRPPVELRRLEVRPLLLGAAAGLERVAPRLRRPLRAVEVEREQLGLGAPKL